MIKLFCLAFYTLMLADAVIAQDMTLSFENKTDRPVILKSLSNNYSVLAADSDVEEQVEATFLESGKTRSVAFTIVSDSYFRVRTQRITASEETTPPSYVDSLCLEIDGEKFTIYWDLEQKTSVWKLKTFTPVGNHQYEIQISQKQNISHQRVPYSYILSITKKVE